MRLILLVVFVFFSINISAQQYRIEYIPSVPQTPFTGIFSEKRIKADKVIYTQYNADGQVIDINNGCTNNVDENYIHYGHHPEGLIDTIGGRGCVVMNRILKFTTNDKLITWELLSLGLFADFEYDESDRILRITMASSRSSVSEYVELTYYNYDQNTITFECIVNGISTQSVWYINYTDSGYVVTYDDGRMMEYIYDNQNRLIRGGEVFYSYTNNGYIKTEKDNRTEYVFEKEYRYLYEIKRYIKESDHWVFSGSTRCEYIFASTVSNESRINIDKIYGVKGGLMMELNKSSEVKIYTSAGRQVYSSWIREGEKKYILLPEGLYVIHTGYGSYKVIIK